MKQRKRISINQLVNAMRATAEYLSSDQACPATTVGEDGLEKGLEQTKALEQTKYSRAGNT